MRAAKLPGIPESQPQRQWRKRLQTCLVPSAAREEVFCNFVGNVREPSGERLRWQEQAPETQRSRERKDPVETEGWRRDSRGSEAAEPAW